MSEDSDMPNRIFLTDLCPLIGQRSASVENRHGGCGRTMGGLAPHSLIRPLPAHTFDRLRPLFLRQITNIRDTS